ncbi:MAG: hypothetical protein CEN90_72 [Parcubacteria group bacterium Licking1014_17]|nr:MAG: hypothetical protein CEN90_72 [Parcubacteria group bacterium Licking1014_17]
MPINLESHRGERGSKTDTLVSEVIGLCLKIDRDSRTGGDELNLHLALLGEKIKGLPKDIRPEDNNSLLLLIWAFSVVTELGKRQLAN